AGRAAERRRMEDLLAVRRVLDEMLRLPENAFAEHVDHDIAFHVEIARLAGNSVLFVVQRTLMELLRPALGEAVQRAPNRELADRSHAAIYAALVAGDPDRARAEMRHHVRLAYDSMLRDLQEPPVIGERRGAAET